MVLYSAKFAAFLFFLFLDFFGQFFIDINYKPQSSSSRLCGQPCLIPVFTFVSSWGIWTVGRLV